MAKPSGSGRSTPAWPTAPVLCAPVVAKEAKEQKKTLQAHYAHLILHGILHAQGWDHELDEDAQVMELRETEIMARLGFKSPY